MSNFNLILRSLEQGICPAELNFNAKATEVIDWEKVKYNTFYKSHEFYGSKFPPELENIPGFDKVVDLIAEKNKDNSPLKEICSRGSQSVEIFSDS